MAKIEIKSELAGIVQSLPAVGQTVAVEDELVLLESMKMEIPIVSRWAGVVTAVCVERGATVAESDVLVVIETR
ncbi:acetyl-CoA carboxylase biotin carboxyl carrier protein subunit [Bradyrhizobium sp. WSM1417]|uniref:acetyl-CoA carboxylase biotin carboxyl carrier protein subunit n=1 Tax=Bradyrhizobium sp. WSM1417 TaxID=754500 RepID=UPI0004809B09|nr:acetyl-CoA carboxylase biotin carboxyl carrier protein subunit [Bradyrhizobium sp. WSM1417]